VVASAPSRVLFWTCRFIAKFHYTDTDAGPTRTRTFFAAKLRWVRAGPFRRKKSVSVSGLTPLKLRPSGSIRICLLAVPVRRARSMKRFGVRPSVSEASGRRRRRGARPRNVETTWARVSFRPRNIFPRIFACCSLNFRSLALYVLPTF